MEFCEDPLYIVNIILNKIKQIFTHLIGQLGSSTIHKVVKQFDVTLQLMLPCFSAHHSYEWLFDFLWFPVSILQSAAFGLYFRMYPTGPADGLLSVTAYVAI